MLFRRWLTLLLLCLLPLSQVLAYPAMRVQNALHSDMSMHAQHLSQSDHASHDCCSGSDQQHHSQSVDQQCDDGHCMSHCTFTLPVISVIKAAKINTPTISQITLAPSSVTLKTPSRPPAFL